MDNNFDFNNNNNSDYNRDMQYNNLNNYSDNENSTSKNIAPDFSNPYSYDRVQEQNNSHSTASYTTINDYSTPQNTVYNPYSPSQYTVNDFTTPKQKKEKKSKKALGFVAAICAVLLASGGSFYAGVTYYDTSKNNDNSTATAVANANTLATSSDSTEVTGTITQVVEEAMPSMVAISTITETTINNPYSFFYGYMYGEDYNQTYETSSSGSGIIIGQNEEELLIVTNFHVIEDSNEIAVEFIDGESYTATVKGTSEDNDLAVISVMLEDISSDTLSQIKVAVMGDSTNLNLGEPAIAIGNSLGYGQSVTVGYISAVNREVQLTDKTMTLIQTDAAINPGNSGGALLNIKGEVIGINSAKYSDTSVEGTGYAIPITDATPIINELMNATYIPEEEKPYLGIYGQDVPESYQERFGWPAGVYVSQISNGSPALLAGVEPGDIITEIAGEEVTTMEELQNVLAKCSVGDRIELTVVRSDNGQLKEGTLTATLIARGDIEE